MSEDDIKLVIDTIRNVGTGGCLCGHYESCTFCSTDFWNWYRRMLVNVEEKLKEVKS